MITNPRSTSATDIQNCSAPKKPSPVPKKSAAADFYISAVRFNEEETFIEQVKVRKNYGPSVGPEWIADRALIAELINSSRLTFKTCIKNGRVWVPGADIYVARGIYLVTDGHARYELILHNLPRF